MFFVRSRPFVSVSLMRSVLLSLWPILEAPQSYHICQQINKSQWCGSTASLIYIAISGPYFILVLLWRSYFKLSSADLQKGWPLNCLQTNHYSRYVAELACFFCRRVAAKIYRLAISVRRPGSDKQPIPSMKRFIAPLPWLSEPWMPPLCSQHIKLNTLT